MAIDPATADLLDRYRAEHAEAKRDLDKMVASAVATKSALPDNYWAMEHEARRKLQLCQQIVEAFNES